MKNERIWSVVVHNLQMSMKEYRCCLKFRRGDNSTYTFTKRGVVYLVSATPPDVQTLEYRYISKLPMKNERIWSYVKETLNYLPFQILESNHISSCTSAGSVLQLCKVLKLYTVVVHNLQMSMKEYRCCLKFRRGGNST
jgi:hypothetical protein